MTVQHMLSLSLLDSSKSKQTVTTFGFPASWGGENMFCLRTVVVSGTIAKGCVMHKVNSSPEMFHVIQKGSHSLQIGNMTGIKHLPLLCIAFVSKSLL